MFFITMVTVMNNNSCYLKYCFQSNIKGTQINTILDKSGNLVAEQEHFPTKDIQINLLLIKFKWNWIKILEEKTISGTPWLYKTTFSTNIMVNVKGIYNKKQDNKRQESHTCLIQKTK